MDLNILTHINYFSVLISAIIYFLIGSLWFSTLFGHIWSKELEKHNTIIKKPTTSQLLEKMAITFGSNILTSLAMAYLTKATGSNTIVSGLILGVITSIGFAATTMATTFSWESRSLKLFLIDIGYPVLGIISSSIILSLWY